jgi:(2Fe-2S) ferredoxin
MRYDYHVFICANQKAEGKRCCGEEAGMEAVKFLREKLIGQQPDKKIRIQKAGCLDLCSKGPALAVYPDACFYRFDSKKDLERIADQHLLGGVPVSTLIIDDES